MRPIVFTLILISAQTAFAQTHSCCSAPEKFASLGSDDAFVMLHEDPLPFKYVPHGGTTISYACADGKNATAFYIPASTKTDKYVFIFHEWWGLNDYIKQTAEKLFHDLGNNVNVIALDMYDGKVATEKQVANEYMQALDKTRAQNIIAGAIDYVGDGAKIATIGWCMGGGFSMQATLAAGPQAIGCVMYYGFPETDVEKIKTLNADILMIWPNQDQWINKQVVEQFRLNMETAGKNLVVKEYDADHAFANPSNPKFNQSLAEDAYHAALAFLKLKLGV